MKKPLPDVLKDVDHGSDRRVEHLALGGRTTTPT